MLYKKGNDLKGMNFHLNRKSRVPLYLQVKEHIIKLIDGRILEEGARLPASRGFAKKLGVNRNTVLSAYQELEVEGKIKSFVGRGTFVNGGASSKDKTAASDAEAEFDAQNFSSDWTKRHSPVFTRYNHYDRLPREVISFAIPSSFNRNIKLQELQNCAYLAIQQFGKHIFELVEPAGIPQLINFLPKRLIRRGIIASENNIMVVNGSQQGLDLIARIFLEPGDVVFTEELLRPATRELFWRYNARIIGIPMDQDGMRMDILDGKLREKRPKFIFTTPDYHNPTTLSATLERRKALLDIACRYEVPILEYDFISDLRYSNEERVPLKALDTCGIVMYVSSFSKILMDGLQFGWIVAAEKVIAYLAAARRATDGQSNNLTQAMVYEFGRRGFYDKLLKNTIRICKKQRDLMLEAITRYFPEEAVAHPVDGGYFVWIDLPRSVSGSEIAKEALVRQVAVVPKFIFSNSCLNDNGLRLCFVNTEESRIEKGIQILGEVLRKKL